MLLIKIEEFRRAITKKQKKGGAWAKRKWKFVGV